jgi:hypothetical protein
VGIAVCCTLTVRLFLGGVQCGGRGGLLAARCMASPTPPLVEVWHLLQSLVGHGRCWWWGVDGAIGKREVAVDADAAWASCT